MSSNKATAVSDEARRKANLRVLQRTDASIHDIVESANFVGLYEFQQQEQQWDKKNTEGSLFLVHRNQHPSNNGNHNNRQSSLTQYQLIILNRSSTDNWILPVTAKLQLQNQEPYLILRYKQDDDMMSTTTTTNTSSPDITISGIWFHNNAERDAIASSLQNAVNELKKHQAELEATAAMAPAPVPVVVDPTAAATALLSPLTLGGVVIPVSHVPATNSNSSTSRPGTTANAPTTPPQPRQSSTTSSQQSSNTHQQQHIVLDKKNLQLSLLSLIQDDRFLDIIHAQYLKVAHARANRAPTNTTNNSDNNNNNNYYTKGGGGEGGS